MPQTTLGRGNILYDWIIQPSLTPVPVAANTSAEQNFTIPGLNVGDFADVNCNAAMTAGLGIVNARVSAANTITLQFANSTGGSLTPTAGAYNINICRPEALPLPTTAA